MCRLIGFASPVPTTLAAHLGDDQVAQFTDMSCVHADGWGTAWLAPNPQMGSAHSPTSYRSTLRGPDDRAFGHAFNAEPSNARLVHLRWATKGLAVTQANTHPFVADGIALAHNGAITPRSELDALLSPQLRQTLHGSTDSERYLGVIRQELPSSPDLGTAVARAVLTLRRQFPHASLNALVLTKATFIAVHASATSVAPPLRELLARGTDHADLPLGHLDSYFLMRWRRATDGSLLFSSTGLHEQGWEPLPPESVTVVDLATMHTTVHELVPGSVR
jgi:predicted glutamine amidotransferase